MVKLAEVGATVGSSLNDKYLQIRKVTTTNPTRVLLIGQSNEGKSVCAASMSEFFPEVLPAPEPVDLKDLVWILLDGDGLLAFPSLGLNVDCIDLTGVPVEHLESMTNAAITKAAEMVDSGEKKGVVFDSLSTFAAKVQGRLKEADDAGVGNTGYWDRVLSSQSRTFSKLTGINGLVVVICHLKAVYSMKSANAEANKIADARLEAQDLEQGDLTLDISGKAREYYWNNFANVWPVQKEGKAPKESFFVYPYGCGPIKGKCKFACLDRKEPANLRKLFQKITAGHK